MIQVFSLFPGLLFLAPLSATILRLAAAYALFYIGNSLIRDRHEVVRVHFPIIGHPHTWMVWLSATIVALTGAFLALGLYTQAAAIVGMLIALKHGGGGRWYPAIMPLSAPAAAHRAASEAPR